jgi:hypothetical protein
MQFIVLKFFAAVADNGNLAAAAVVPFADLYLDWRRAPAARRSRV